jgi:hypothetical protein
MGMKNAYFGPATFEITGTGLEILEIEEFVSKRLPRMYFAVVCFTRPIPSQKCQRRCLPDREFELQQMVCGSAVRRAVET